MIKELICRIFGHKYYHIKTLERHVTCVGCRRCGKYWERFEIPSVKTSYREWNGYYTRYHNFSPVLYELSYCVELVQLIPRVKNSGVTKDFNVIKKPRKSMKKNKRVNKKK